MFQTADVSIFRHLGWVKEPEKLPGLTRERPDPAQKPRIVGRYNGTPKGGRAKSPAGEYLFCAHCQAHTHWKGYVLASAGGSYFMIGSECGSKHYGAERFSRARQDYKQIEDREKLKSRGRFLLGMAAEIQGEINSILAAPGLHQIEQARDQLRKASPDTHMRFTSNIASGEPLKRYTMVRGSKGNLEPALRSIGHIQGKSLVCCDVRKRAGDLIAALLAVEAITVTEWEEANPAKLLSPVRAVERASLEMLNARQESLKAHEFFSASNRRRLIKWAEPHHRHLSIVDEDSEKLLVIDSRVQNGPIEVLAFDKVVLPRLRACEKIRDAAEAVAEEKRRW